MEKTQLLEDQNWKKIGACEISCVAVYDHLNPKEIDVEVMAAVNAEIKMSIQVGIKPKTEIDLLKEQIAALTEKINNPVVPEIKKEVKTEGGEPTEKEIRKALFTEAKELGLTPMPTTKTDILKDLVAKAKEAK
jgi:predicted metal-dependent TIM-barrel fold hydrolase